MLVNGRRFLEHVSAEGGDVIAVLVLHGGNGNEAFASEDPFVRQFLAGESAGPLGMD